MKRIIAAIDFSDATDAVIETASSLAKALHAKIYLLHIDPATIQLCLASSCQNMATATPVMGYDTSAPTSVLMEGKEWQQAEEALKRQSMATLEKLHDRLQKAGISVENVLLEGMVEEQIHAQAEALQADMLIIGNHKHSFMHHLLFGEISRHFIANSPCPVLIVPAASQ